MSHIKQNVNVNVNMLIKLLSPNIGVARGGPKGPCPPKFLKRIVILYFQRRFSKQNRIILLKSDILASPKIFCHPPISWAGYATVTKAKNQKTPITERLTREWLTQALLDAVGRQHSKELRAMQAGPALNRCIRYSCVGPAPLGAKYIPVARK